MEKEEGISRRKFWKRHSCVEDVLLFRMVEIYVEILSLGRSCLS